MDSLLLQDITPGSNPLDLVEEVLFMRDLPHDRPSDDELVTEIPTSWGPVRLWFVWQPQQEQLIASGYFSTRIPAPRIEIMHALLSLANESLQLGHFLLFQEDREVIYRYTFLLHGQEAPAPEQIEHFLDIVATECERFYPAFQSAVWGGKNALEALQSAMFETVGEA